MNRRPTPETDKAKCKFTSLFGDDEDAYWVPLKVAKTLEIERDELREQLKSERALADRLAGVLNKAIEIIPDDAYVAERIEVRRWEKALTAWKEARSE